MATNDFYLNFGSDANPFAKELATELAPGIAQINALTEAILKYDEAVGSLHTGNPLGNLFGQLDQASAKLESIGGELGTAFEKITTSLGTLTGQLRGALTEISQATRAAADAGKVKPPPPRTQATQVTDEELSPAKLAQTQRTVAVATTNGDAARNAVKRVADINATLARNAADSADQLIKLGEAIRSLTTMTKVSTRGVTEGRFQQNTVYVQGGGASAEHLGNVSPAVVQAVLAQAGIQEAQQAPVRDQAHQAQRDASDAQQRAQQLERAGFTAAAQPGLYQVPGETATRTVTNRINPGESFDDYFARVASNTQGLNRIRQEVVQRSESRVGIQGSQDIQDVQRLIGRRGLETLSGPEHAALNDGRTPGSIPTSTIRASVQSVLGPSNALTPEQYALVPQALAEFKAMQADFAALAKSDVASRISANPAETFAFAPERAPTEATTKAGRARGLGLSDPFGQVQDYRAAVSEYDLANPDNPGVGVRAAAEERIANGRANSRAYRPLNDGLNVRPETVVIGDTGRAPKAPADTTAKYDQMVEQEIAAAREARQAAEESGQAAVKITEAATKLEEVASGGGRGPRPPRPPRPPAGGSENEQPEEEPTGVSSPRATRRGQPYPTPESSPKVAELQAALDENTRAVLEDVKAKLPGLTGNARAAEIERAGTAFAADPAFGNIEGGVRNQRRSLGGLLGLNTGGADYQTLGNVLGAQGSGTAQLLGGRSNVSETQQAAEAEARYAAALAETEGKTVAETNAILRRFKAQEQLNAANAQGSTLQRASAQIGLNNADEDLSKTRASISARNTPQTLQQGLFGQAGFAQNQLRHVGLGLENVVGYTLVFTGFDKLQELAHTGLESDAAFVRLQASLEANGIAAGNLRTQLAGISASTATPLQHTIEAASELAGVFNNAADLAFGTKIAAQLANISQGTLTAKEAAVGLRDVIDAYAQDWAAAGVSAKDAIQQTGDEVARLSQTTGVGVKDILEGTTQFAQEAHDYHLDQNQAATIAAYASRATGETGEQSASQASRFLATLRNPKLQQILTTTQVPGERGANGAPVTVASAQQFASGDISGVLTSLLTNFDKLTPSSQAAIQQIAGVGIQARVFSAIMHDGTTILQQFTDAQNAAGALAKQNASYLHTVAGEIKQFDEDFQNLGNTLTRLGAFDSIGLLAKAADDLVKAFSAFFNLIADFADSNPLTKALLPALVVTGELAVAFKLLAGVGASVFGRAGLLTAVNASSVGSPVIGAGGVATGELVAAQYGRLSPGRILNGTLGAGARVTASDVATREEQVLSRGGLRGVAGSVIGLPGRAYRSVSGGISGIAAEQRASFVASEASRIEAEQAAAGFRYNSAGRAVSTTGIGSFVPVSSIPENLRGTPASLAEESTQSAARRIGAVAGDVGTRGVGALEKGLNSSLGKMIGLGAALAVVGVVADQIMAARAQDKADQKTGQITLGTLDGTQAAKDAAAKASAATGTNADPLSAIQQAGKRAGSAGGFATFGSRIISGDVTATDGFQGVSDKYSNDYIKLVLSQNKAIRALPKDASVDDINAAKAASDKDFQNQVDGLVKEAGNKNNQTQAIAELATLKERTDESYAKRLLVAQGLSGLDALNATQVGQLGTYYAQLSQYNNKTLSEIQGLNQSLQQDLGLTPGSAADKQSKIALGLPGSTQPAYTDGTTTNAEHAQTILPTDQERRDAEIASIKLGLAQDATRLADTTGQYATGGKGSAREALQQQDAQQAQLLQQLQTQNDTVAVNLPQTQATNALNVGNTADAVKYLNQTKTALQALIAPGGTYDSSQKEYYDTLAQIQDAQLKLAQLKYQESTDAAALEAAGSNDAATKARDAQIQANNNLQAAKDAGLQGTALAPYQQAQAAADLGARSTQQSITQAQLGAQFAGVRSGTGQARAAITEAAQRENAYRGGGSLADQASYYAAVQSYTQAQAQLRDALEADAQGAYDAASAIQKLHGDEVGAAQTAYAKAQANYTYQVKEYGQNSAQAEAAFASTIQAQQAVQAAALAQITAGLDLEIAELNARGVGQGGDAGQAAAGVAVQKAQAALNSYQAAGGQTGTAQSDQLQAALVTAQRSQFDTALNAQLDTLDFQKQTYQITGAQEVAALQQILQNKQLTLAEQRNITLKIKGLQDDIRNQLTSGGLNIPSDIKLPTAYDVRRSLGAGFAGNATSTSVVNNNQQATVTVNQTLPNAALAAAVAASVIALLNQQTGQQVRANSATPRLVPTG